ncbi:hypothetical protein [Granulicatella adiacens]|uniref:hypothetical protein n=1 Tax=Granulicatella adiacens TaxID=46124 RepID=UPI00241BF861|nr:hypothetical protein [Granulicatella adiacens]
MEITKSHGNRYYTSIKEENKREAFYTVSDIYFHQIYAAKMKKQYASESEVRKVAYFYEVMKRIDQASQRLIYEKYFKLATVQRSKDTSNLNKREYVVKHCPNYKHAEILGLTLNQYKIKLDYALRKFLRVLIEVRKEKEG